MISQSYLNRRVLSNRNASINRFGLAIALALAILSGCSDNADEFSSNSLVLARNACTSAAEFRSMACAGDCSRLPDASEAGQCESVCTENEIAESGLCAASLGQFSFTCTEGSCNNQLVECLDQSTTSYAQCSDGCDGPDDLFCHTRCQRARANDEQSCGFLPAEKTLGGFALPNLIEGEPAFLPSLLDEAELAVVEEADRRAESLRSRPMQLWTGAANTSVNITQVEHAFRFGLPLDIREFENDEDGLAFYGQIGRPHASLLVAETSLKWRNTEREEGVLTFDLADRELAWAESLGFDTKGHVLLWGNPPPLASGSGTPEWLRDKFETLPLSNTEQDELRALIKTRIETVVGKYSGRIDVWEVTNEMLNPLTPWFIDRLGPEIVEDAFRWARQADPGAELVYNEWIKDIFTGLGGPDATAVRDRVIELKDAGIPIDALGQQGHFAPGLVNIGIDVDLSERTRIDDYAQALDTLAEAGLPIHITEVTFAAPEEPEHRAAQAEAVMRLWWGHPQVEEIIIWNFWNPLGPRSHLNLGVFGDDGEPTRHGEAILSLLNDRWRTRVDDTTDQRGVIEFTATYGEYIAQWQTDDGPVHIRFRVERGSDMLRVVATQAN